MKRAVKAGWLMKTRGLAEVARQPAQLLKRDQHLVDALGLRRASERGHRARADDAVGFQAGLGLRGLDDRHQFVAIGLAVDRSRKHLAIVAAHLVVEIAGDQVQELGQFRIGLAGLQQQLGIDDDIVLGAGVQRLEFDAQRLVFGVVRMPRFEPAARVGRKRQDFQRADHVERLFRKIVVAGDACSG